MAVTNEASRKEWRWKVLSRAEFLKLYPGDRDRPADTVPEDPKQADPPESTEEPEAPDVNVLDKDHVSDPAEPTLEEIGIDEKHAKKLRDAGVKTLDDVLNYGDLTEVRGIGDVAKAEIEGAVNLYIAAQGEKE